MTLTTPGIFRYSALLRDAMLTAGLAAILALPLVGFRTVDRAAGLTLDFRFHAAAILVGMVLAGRLMANFIIFYPRIIAALSLVCLAAAFYIDWPESFLRFFGAAGSLLLFCIALRREFSANPALDLQKITRRAPSADIVMGVLVLSAFVLPMLPFASRYVLDVMVMVLTYIALAFGLNVVVGFAGLLDLGYVGFYAIGAYASALLAQNFGIGFWTGLPIAGGAAVLTACLIGGPVLRLRGDYLAIVTLGFAEIVRLVLINWGDLTGGPNGISGTPRPSLFSLEFVANPKSGSQTFHGFLGLEYSPIQRMVFLYYLIFGLAVFIGIVSALLRKLPIGRAWEALREDETACAALGINASRAKLCAYALGALCAGLCGAFFSARQGFISPESFSFAETCAVLAIVVLGGVGHPLGIVMAAMFIIGLPELFRELEQYRMIAFGAGMVLIMIWRPGGLMATRNPAVRISEEHTDFTSK